MSWNNLTTKTTSDPNSADDINQLMENIRVVAGNGTSAPTSNIQSMYNTQTAYASLYGKKDIDNLSVVNGTNAAYQLDVSFTGLRVENVYLTSVSTTISITTMLDTGSEAANTWYYVWIFAKADGSYCFRFSTSYTSPTVPSGYTYKRRISVVRNNASSNFVSVRQKNLTYLIENTAILSGGTASSRTSVDLSTYVPHNIIDTISGNIKQGTSSKVTYLSPTNSTVGELTFLTSSSSYTGMFYFKLPMLSQYIYYYSDATGSVTIYIASYTIII